MAKIIGTSGHVDHGKTTLIKALTGIDADRLPEEKRRGLTIDIGFAYIDLPEIGRVSIVDVPGHERFIHNMLVGALGMDVALLCVAADEGAMPQTREHLMILDLLPVQKLVVALTKADLADAGLVEAAQGDVRDALADTRFKDAPIQPVSAHTGAGLDELKQILARELAGASPPAQPHWYLPIDRAFSVKGHGAVVTGTLMNGVVRVGDKAVVQPGSLEVRVRQIHSHETQLEEAEYGRRTALNLGGIKLEDLRRGMAVGDPDGLFETKLFDATVRWVKVPKHGARVRVSIGAEEVIAKVFLNADDPSQAQFRLEAPAACALDQPFIVRRYSPMEVWGGGKVRVPQAVPRRRTEAALTLKGGQFDKAAILEALGTLPSGLQNEELARVLGKSVSSLGPHLAELSQEGAIVGFAGLWLSGKGLEAGRAQFLAAMRAAHDSQPSIRSHPRERIVASAKLTWSGKALDRLLAHLAEAGDIVVEGASVRAAGFKVSMNAKQRALLDRVAAELDRAGINCPSPAEIAQALSIPPQAAEEVLRLGVQAGEIIRIEAGIHYTAGQMEKIREQVRALAAKGPFAASDFRDATGSTRKYVIPLLEHLDAARFTMRQGDKRVLA